MEAIMLLFIGLVSAWVAYSVVAAEQRSRGWAGATTVGVFLALFGAVSTGLGWVYGFLRPKLIDQFPSENTMLLVGLIIIAAMVTLVLDLLGTIDIMGQLQKSLNTNRANPGGPASRE